ncbi:MAG: hypothetical protein IIT58_08935 [Treponema sp.]|nr:hypothetical protein [Treponema sp.]
MNKAQETILRISGIIFFLLTIATSLEMLSRAVASWIFMIESESVGWGVFYVLTSVLFCSFFIFASFATGLAAIFAGKSPYTQAVWNCAFYAMVAVALFAGLQAFTGITEDDANIFYVSIAAIGALLIYMLICFFCLKDEEDFYWKNLFSFDSGVKLCFKVWLIMILVFQVGTFIYAHKILE